MPRQSMVHAGTQCAHAIWTVLLAWLAMLPATALADAGAVRVSQRDGSRRITVFTDPTSLRAGPIDVSILVQDITTGGAILGEAIEIEVAPHELSSAAVHYQATSAAASNKLLQAANFELPHAGWWEFTINVRGSHGNSSVYFEADAGEPLPRWQATWPWFCWPFLVVAFFALFQFPASLSSPPEPRTARTRAIDRQSRERMRKVAMTEINEGKVSAP